MRRANPSLVVFLLALAALQPALQARDDEGIDPETLARVKSAYVLNFARFTTWPRDCFDDEPEGKLAPLLIGVLGRNGLEDVLDGMASFCDLDGRPVEVRRFLLPERRAGEDAAAWEAAVLGVYDGLRSCHILFLAGSEAGRIDPVLSRLSGADVLTVSDVPGFVRKGGMLGLILEGDHVAFEANPEAIELTRLRVSSKVLRLARIVSRDGR